MTSKPILFSAPMVRAILGGTKTQTRRVIDPQSHDINHRSSEEVNAAWQEGWINEKCPYGKPGDKLWVREAWQTLPYYDDMPPRNIPEGADIIYNADRPHCPWDSRKRNARHMPRWASRITLKITGVRVERLQDISEEDARAEGIIDGGCLNCGESEPCGCKNPQPDARESFLGEGQSIHGNDPVTEWTANPWVWVIEFERVK